MGGGGGSAPTLDAASIGNNQTSSNVNAAVNTQKLNMVNQVTPFGSLNYSNTGGSYDYNGNWIPSYTATTTLEPGQQKLLDSRTGSQQSLFDLAKSYLPQASASFLSMPTYGALPDTQAFQDNAYKALTARSNQDIGMGEDAQRSLNANQGVAAGSEAYNRSFQPFERSRVDASNQATINAGTMADQFIARQIKGNDYSQQQHLLPMQNFANLLGLAGGATQPTFANTPQTQVQAPDVTSPALAQYAAQMQQYQQGKNSGNALMGSLFGLGGAALGGFLGGPLGAGVGKSLFGLGGNALGGGSGSTY